MLLRVQLRVIDLDLVGREVERQPQEEIGDQHEADEIVHADRGAERHHVDQPDIADLHARQDHQDEAEGIGPVPDPDRQRVDVESAWCCSFHARSRVRRPLWDHAPPAGGWSWPLCG